jgi:hypothetical protein
MSLLSIYYLSVAVTCLAISIYNFSVSSQSKNLQCFELEEITQSDYQSYVNYLKNNTQAYNNFMIIINRNESGKIYTDEHLLENTEDEFITVPILINNKYAGLQEAVGALYVVIMFFSIIESLSIRFMSDMVPEEFLHLNKLTQTFGFISKNLPYFIASLHYAVFVLILVIWGYIGTTSCFYSVNIKPGEYSYWNRMFMDTWIMNLVTSIFWLLLHYVGAIIREIFYKEPFMYINYKNQKGKFRCCRWLMTRVGP